MNIKSKLNYIFIALFGVIAFVVIINLYSKHRLASTLDFITGPAWDSADGAMEGAIEIERQMLLVNKFINRGLRDEERSGLMASLSVAIATADEALQRLERTGLVRLDKLAELADAKKRFDQLRESLLKNSKAYFDSQLLLYKAFDAYERFFADLESLGDSAVDVLESEPDRMISWNSGLEERWSLADGAMEANIALLSRIYFYERMVAEGETDQIRAKLENSLKVLGALVDSLENNALVKKTEFNNGVRQTYAKALIGLHQEHEQTFSSTIEKFRVFVENKSAYDAVASSLLDSLVEVEELGDAEIEKQGAVIERLNNLNNSLIILSIALALFIAFFARRLALRDIADPLTQISSTLAGARNDLTFKLDTHYSGEIGKLSHEINGFNHSTRQTLRSIGEKISELNEVTHLLSDLAKQNAASAGDQKHQVQGAVTSLEQLSMASNRIADGMSETRNLIFSLRERVNEGNASVEKSVSVSIEASEQLESANRAIANLQEQSHTIGSVLTVINNIAEQTNLLALNAAIEAARAGEQGRGFAVVADEVRNLAQKTQESTHSIHSTIEQLQKTANETAGMIGSCVNSSTTSREMVTGAGDVLLETINAIEKLVAMSADVSAAAGAQANFLQEVNSNVNTINACSEASEKLASEAQALAWKISEVSQQQQDDIKRFSF